MSQQLAELMLSDAGLSPAEDLIAESADSRPGVDPAGEPPDEDLAEIYLDPFRALSVTDVEQHDINAQDPVAATVASGSTADDLASEPSHGPAASPAGAWPTGAGSSATDPRPTASWVDEPDEADEPDRQASLPEDRSRRLPLKRGQAGANGRSGSSTGGGVTERWAGLMLIGGVLVLCGVLVGFLLAGHSDRSPATRAPVSARPTGPSAALKTAPAGARRTAPPEAVPAKQPRATQRRRTTVSSRRARRAAVRSATRRVRSPRTAGLQGSAAGRIRSAQSAEQGASAATPSVPVTPAPAPAPGRATAPATRADPASREFVPWEP